jgi:protein TonB
MSVALFFQEFERRSQTAATGKLLKFFGAPVSILLERMTMNGALIYRSNSRWLIWVAFACALTIHVAAIALAKNKSEIALPDLTPPGKEIEGVDIQPSEPQEIDVTPENVLPMADEDVFPQENATPPPIRPRKKTPPPPVARSIGTGATSAMRGGSVKALTLYAPRPAYPYEARRGGITGSGIAELTVNRDAGIVIEARMAQSTGSAILDDATVETLRRWRFKPGTSANIQVPITFTLTGVSY